MKKFIFNLFLLLFGASLFANEGNDFSYIQLEESVYESSAIQNIDDDQENKKVTIERATLVVVDDRYEDVNIVCKAVRNVAAGAALYAGASAKAAKIAGYAAFTACMLGFIFM